MGWVINVKHRSLYLQESPPYSLYRKLCGLQGQVRTFAENFASSGILSPDRPAGSESLYRLRYSDPLFPLYYIFLFSCFSFSYYSAHILSYSDPFFVHFPILSSSAFVVPSLFTIGCSGTNSKEGTGKIHASRNPMWIKATGLFLDC